MKELLVVTGDHSESSMRGGGGDENPLSLEFQTKQVDRIVEAIALTLPQGHNQ